MAPAGMLIGYRLLKRNSVDSSWHGTCDPHLLQHLLVGQTTRRSSLPILGVTVGWLLASLSLAGPAWERIPQPLHNTMQARVILLDLSLSMKSTDMLPNRLERAKFKITDLIKNGKGYQQGLVVFAGDAFVVAPLTDDKDTLINLIPDLDSNTIPIQGSRSDLGLKTAYSLLENTETSRGEIILIGDGVNHQSIDIANDIASQGHRISIIAMGTTEGAPVQLADGGLLKDSSGNIVIPGVNFEEIRQVASIANGVFTSVSADDSDIQAVTDPNFLNQALAVNNRILGDSETHGFSTNRWIDNGFWLILPLLVIVAASFRRGWILLLVVAVAPLYPVPVLAFDWDDLWLRKDQQYTKNIQAENYDAIPFTAPAEWLGAARYRAGDYRAAVDTYAGAGENDAIAHFNHGNALAKTYSLQESLNAYDKALEIDPDFEDARFNRELIEQLLDQQNQEQNAERGENQQDNSNESRDEQDEMKKSGSNQQNLSGENSDKKSEQKSGEPGDSDAEDTAQSNQEKNDEKSQNDTLNEQEIAEEAEATAKAGSTQTLSEQEQALEQWLQRIPDDPGGLLRRKFAYQYSRREPQPESTPW